MPSPIDAIAVQAQKGPLTETEMQVLQRASARDLRYKVLGGALGCAFGYYFTRRNPSLAVKGFMILFNGAFVSSLSAGLATLKNFRELSDASKYPHIHAAMKDLSQELARSRGTHGVQRKANIKDLPPSMTEEERAMRAHEGMLFDKELGSFGEGYSHEQSDSQYSFGNPALQQGTDAHPVLDTVNTQAPTAWDSIRKANGPPENAWNKVRKQSTSQQQQPQQQSSPSQQSASSQLAGAWSKAGQHDHNEGSSLDSSADWAPGAPALKSDEFPRSREDFEEASRTTTTKYGDSVYS